MITKILGWLLFTAGLVMIVGSLYYSYNIFTGKGDVPMVFKIEANKNSSSSQTNGTTDAQAAIEKTVEKQIKGLFPEDTLPKAFNLLASSILAGILIFGGTQVSGLGIRLIK